MVDVDHSRQMIQVKIIYARLAEIGLYSGLLTTATAIAWWYWQAQGGEAIDPSASLLTRLLLQRSIVLAFAFAEFVLGFAVLLACVPMRWWLSSDVFAVPEVSPVTWLAQTISRGAAPDEPATTPAPVDNVEDPAQPPVSGAQPEPGAPAQGQPAAQAQPAATPGQPAAPAQKSDPASPQAQPPAQSAAQPPAQSPAQAPAQPAAQTPGQPATQGQSTETESAPAQSPLQAAQIVQEGQLNLEEELDPLESLADVSDLLRSTFDDEEEVDPWLAELSASLPEVEMESLRTMARSLTKGLRGRRAAAPLPAANGRAAAAHALVR